MADSTWVNTALDLNLNPLKFPHRDEVPVKRGFGEGDHLVVDLERKASVRKENAILVEELNRINSENRKLTQMLKVVCENYNGLHKQYIDLKSKNSKNEVSTGANVTSRKRKSENDQHDQDNSSHLLSGSNNGHTECCCSDESVSFKRLKSNRFKTKVSRVHVRTTPFDTTLIVKDGYQWRKYGQKVTRDNPSPRAYYRCSFAPSCPVKKKVQRSVADRNVLVATYEGVHNHPPPSNAEIRLSPTHGSPTAAVKSSGPSVTLDQMMQEQPRGSKLTVDANPKSVKDDNIHDQAPAVIQQILVQQMAASLTQDPSFKAAISAAISGRFADQTTTGQW